MISKKLGILLIVLFFGTAACTRQMVEVIPSATPVIVPTVEPTAPPIKIQNQTTAVSVIDGDIAVKVNGTWKKITNWKHNYSPVISPDGTRIAYFSQTQAAIDAASDRSTFLPDYSNIYVINIDGTKPIKITTDIGYFYFPNNLRWLDDNNLRFTEGVASVRQHNLLTHTTTTVFGSKETKGGCIDACGEERGIFASPNNQYYVTVLAADEKVTFEIYNNLIQKRISATATIPNLDFQKITFNPQSTEMYTGDGVLTLSTGKYFSKPSK